MLLFNAQHLLHKWNALESRDRASRPVLLVQGEFSTGKRRIFLMRCCMRIRGKSEICVEWPYAQLEDSDDYEADSKTRHDSRTTGYRPWTYLLAIAQLDIPLDAVY
jgi:hypothetical protein